MNMLEIYDRDIDGSMFDDKKDAWRCRKMAEIFDKDLDGSWFCKQMQEPFCTKMLIYIQNCTDRYCFEFDDCLVYQSISNPPIIKIVDRKNNGILAYVDDVEKSDMFRLCEKLFESSHGNENVPKEKADAIIWKLMIGDMRLVTN